MKFKMGSLMFLSGLGIVIIISLLGIYIFKTQNQFLNEGVQVSDIELTDATTPSDFPTQTDIPSDWKKYISKNYNFEFSYPPDAKLNDQSDSYVAVSFMGDKQKATGRTQTELFDGYAFNVADVTGNGYSNLDEFYQDKVKGLENVCSSIGTPENIIVDGRQAITQKLSCLGDYDVYYIKNGNTYLEIGLLHVGDEQDLPGYTKTVNQIFSTFKFTN